MTAHMISFFFFSSVGFTFHSPLFFRNVNPRYLLRVGLTTFVLVAFTFRNNFLSNQLHMPLYACCWFFFGFGLTAFINSCLLYRYVNPASWRYRHNPDAPSETFPRNHHMPSEHCFCVKNLLPVPWIYWKPLPLHTPLHDSLHRRISPQYFTHP